MCGQREADSTFQRNLTGLSSIFTSVYEYKTCCVGCFLCLPSYIYMKVLDHVMPREKRCGALVHIVWWDMFFCRTVDICVKNN